MRTNRLPIATADVAQLAASSLVGCAPKTIVSQATVSPGAISTPIPTSTSRPAPRITEIILERDPSMGHYVAYLRVRLRADGRAIRVSRGTQQATISRADFDRLAQRFEDIHFVDEAMYPGMAMSDAGRVILSIVRDGRRKTVCYQSGETFDTSSLRALDRAVCDQAQTLNWTRVSDQAVDFPRLPSDAERAAWLKSDGWSDKRIAEYLRPR